MVLKYALHPGSILCKMDGLRHQISARQLAALYGVPFDECAVVDAARPCTLTPTVRGLVQLYPDPSGRYDLPARAA